MLKAMFDKKLKIEGNEDLKIKRKYQPSSDAVSDFVASSTTHIALIQPPSSRSRSVKK